MKDPERQRMMQSRRIEQYYKDLGDSLSSDSQPLEQAYLDALVDGGISQVLGEFEFEDIEDLCAKLWSKGRDLYSRRRGDIPFLWAQIAGVRWVDLMGEDWKELRNSPNRKRLLNKMT
jgi:hypothetical protein